jgi:hypothetical protein
MDGDGKFARRQGRARPAHIEAEGVPPGVALAAIPVLLHPGHWFPLLVVLPFTAVAVASAAALSKCSRFWPEYPKPLRDWQETEFLSRISDTTRPQV